MSTIKRVTGSRAGEAAPPTGAEVVGVLRDDSGRLLRRAGWGAATLVALIAAGVCVGGCGDRSSGRSAAQAPQPAVVTPTSGGDVVAAGATGLPSREPGSEALAAASVDSLAPDVAATLSEERVSAGTSVEITAQGSPDVVGVTLGDGSGGRAPFAYDASADLWRVAYRVPVRPGSERLALSVTARNAAGRWRRVWVFLNVEQDTAVGDSVSSGKP